MASGGLTLNKMSAEIVLYRTWIGLSQLRIDIGFVGVYQLALVVSTDHLLLVTGLYLVGNVAPGSCGCGYTQAWLIVTAVCTHIVDAGFIRSLYEEHDTESARIPRAAIQSQNRVCGVEIIHVCWHQ